MPVKCWDVSSGNGQRSGKSLCHWSLRRRIWPLGLQTSKEHRLKSVLPGLSANGEARVKNEKSRGHRLKSVPLELAPANLAIGAVDVKGTQAEACATGFVAVWRTRCSAWLWARYTKSRVKGRVGRDGGAYITGAELKFGAYIRPGLGGAERPVFPHKKATASP
jgi:hypothetical protein